MNNSYLISEVIKENDELKTLKALQMKLAETIDATKSARDIAALTRQLKDLSERIAILEENAGDGLIDDILQERKECGAAGKVRQRKRFTE